ncbi:MAG: GNAT family N-acetyltransferase [Pseudomonadota bacterium]
MDPLTITQAEPGDPAVRQVLEAHHALMRSQSPAESCHVLDPEELTRAGAVLFAARDGETVLGVGAIAPLAADQAELKSMHTTAAARGRGVGRAILERLTEEARAQGITSLWLETGSAPEFAAARGLYAAAGFTECPPFGDYSVDPLSLFMMRAL